MSTDGKNKKYNNSYVETWLKETMTDDDQHAKMFCLCQFEKMECNVHQQSGVGFVHYL